MGMNIFHMWKEIRKVGLYIVISHLYVINVGLVLDQVTVYVSPQFHIYIDPGFYTVNKDDFDSL